MECTDLENVIPEISVNQRACESLLLCALANGTLVTVNSEVFPKVIPEC